MRASLLIFIVILISACNNRNLDYSKLNGIEDLNDDVLSAFINQVIDTTIGDCFLDCVPIIDAYFMEGGLPQYSNEDQLFFERQIEKFQSISWQNIVESDRIIDEAIRNDIWENGWKEFENSYEGRCFCSISIPVFSLDFTLAFIDVQLYYGYNSGWQDILIFELIENSWELSKRMNIGIR